ncbi:helix-turn-helix domain-containing protein [Tsuneonella sp. HG222]
MVQQSNERMARMRFFAVAPELKPYLTAIYLNDVVVPAGESMEDMLHPEWANLRFMEGHPGSGAIGEGPRQPTPHVVLVGPTSRATAFETGSIRSWGIGFQPLGWARFIARRAADFADQRIDAESDPDLEHLTALRPFLADPQAAPEGQAETINRHLTALLATTDDDDPAIARVHAALADPDIGTVTELAERVGMSGRTLERLSLRAFGFSPKLLLRRQRFLRTLGQVMLNPQMRWSDSLDSHYHDQAHFNRDFKYFMGLSPNAYMARPHPIVDAAVRGRMAAEGAPMQVLHRPPAALRRG